MLALGIGETEVLGPAGAGGTGSCYHSGKGSAAAGTKLSSRRQGLGCESHLLGMCGPSWKWDRMKKCLPEMPFRKGQRDQLRRCLRVKGDTGAIVSPLKKFQGSTVCLNRQNG